MTRIQRGNTRMMRSSAATVRLIGILGCVAMPALAAADPIRLVDTGPSGPAATRSVDWNTQWLAAEFVTASAWRITSVAGWIVPSGFEQSGGPLRITLLSDGGDVPAIPLFSTVTHIPGVGPAGWMANQG